MASLFDGMHAAPAAEACRRHLSVICSKNKSFIEQTPIDVLVEFEGRKGGTFRLQALRIWQC